MIYRAYKTLLIALVIKYIHEIVPSYMFIITLLFFIIKYVFKIVIILMYPYTFCICE